MTTATLPRMHVALGVNDVDRAVLDYAVRLGCAPTVHVPGEYALFRPDGINFSVRRADGPPSLRHLGWEDPDAESFSSETDANGICWERFTLEQQLEEIRSHWPDATGI